MLTYFMRIRQALTFGMAWQSWRMRGLMASGLGVIAVVALTPWRPGLVVGHSMEPTLPHGTIFLYDRFYYRNHPVRPGDVVVVRHWDELWVKRVYAGAGTTFWTLRRLDDEIVRHDPIRASARPQFVRMVARLRLAYGADYRVVPVRVPTGRVFLVGDGTTSEDSRMFGVVDTEEILGRVVALPGQQLESMPDWIELSTPRSERGDWRGKTQDDEATGNRT